MKVDKEGRKVFGCGPWKTCSVIREQWKRDAENVESSDQVPDKVETGHPKAFFGIKVPPHAVGSNRGSIYTLRPT